MSNSISSALYCTRFINQYYLVFKGNKNRFITDIKNMIYLLLVYLFEIEPSINIETYDGDKTLYSQKKYFCKYIYT